MSKKYPQVQGSYDPDWSEVPKWLRVSLTVILTVFVIVILMFMAS